MYKTLTANCLPLKSLKDKKAPKGIPNSIPRATAVKETRRERKIISYRSGSPDISIPTTCLKLSICYLYLFISHSMCHLEIRFYLLLAFFCIRRKEGATKLFLTKFPDYLLPFFANYEINKGTSSFLFFAAVNFYYAIRI